MLSTFEINGTQVGEYPLFIPLFGSHMTEKQPLHKTMATRNIDKIVYELEIYEDRLEGIQGDNKIFIRFDGEIVFYLKAETNRIYFRNDEMGKFQSYTVPRKEKAEKLCRVLEKVCPQIGFFQKYEIVERLGEGKNSFVYKVVRKQDCQLFACKLQKNSSAFQREIETLKKLDHPNLIYLKEFFIEADQMTYTIMNYEDGGNLLSIIKSNKGISLKQIVSIICDLLNALQFLRIKGIVHRDIKPENIVKSEKNGKYKIADFGLARNAGEQFDKVVGTPGYIAPEVIQNKVNQISLESDIYSMGLVFFEIFTGVQYFQGTDFEQILNKNTKAKSFKKKLSGFDFSTWERELLQKMIRTNPQNRKSSLQILCSSTVKKMKKMHKGESRESTKSKQSEGEDEDSISLVKTVKKMLHLMGNL